jgi:eukaryotic-like serine/threonine-protein kinase
MCALAMRPNAMPSSHTLRRDRRLNAAIVEYLQAIEAGRAPNRRDFLERHCDLTDGLVSFFANEDRVKCMAGLPRPRMGMEFPSSRSGPPDSNAELAAGRDIGEFELLNKIASGGMGVVYKARHKRLNRIVALKTIQTGVLHPADDVVRRLRIEAKVVAALDHPNIVPLYEVGEHGGYPYLILKLIKGGDLERHLPRLRRNPGEVVRIMAKVARTVHYAHVHGILHCDLKPSNILLDLRGAPHVTDFGLAMFVEAESGLTRTGNILGTPSYMAPEQISGRRREMTAAVDIYGLGAVLYKLLTGRPPFQAESVYDLLEQVRHCEPEPLRDHNRAVDRDLETICLKCLEKSPSLRYESAMAVSADLERWRAGAPIWARPLGRWERVTRWYHQNRTAIAVAAALVGLVMIFVLTAVATATIICHYELAAASSPPASRTVERHRPRDDTKHLLPSASQAISDSRGR